MLYIINLTDKDGNKTTETVEAKDSKTAAEIAVLKAAMFSGFCLDKYSARCYKFCNEYTEKDLYQKDRLDDSCIDLL